jgi:hypothetical protein
MEDVFVVKENAIFEKSVAIEKKLYVDESMLVNQDMNTTNLNIDGLFINLGNNYFTGKTYINDGTEENKNNSILLENNGTILAKKLLININETETNTNMFVKSISLNRVIESLKQYYTSIINVNNVVNYILQNVEIIKKNGLNNVLKPYVENLYYEEDDYFYIATLSKNNETILPNNKILSTYKKYIGYIDILIGDLIELNNQGKYIYFENDGYVMVNGQYEKDLQAFDIINKIGINNINYYNVLKEWDNGIKIDYKCLLYIPDILPNIEGVNPDYIVVACGVQLDKIIENINNINLFSPEYVKFSKKITENMFIIQDIYNNLKENKFESIIDYDVWEYTTNICYYSSLYKDWIGKSSANCKILGKFINIFNIVAYIFDFMTNNLLLTNDQQVGIIQYSYDNANYLFLTKIIILNNKKYLIVNTLLIDDFFNNSIETNGDLVVEGSLHP